MFLSSAGSAQSSTSISFPATRDKDSATFVFFGNSLTHSPAFPPKSCVLSWMSRFKDAGLLVVRRRILSTRDICPTLILSRPKTAPEGMCILQEFLRLT